MKKISCVEDARMLIQQGKIIAYPTEAVYGLGCDPWNKNAVEKLFLLKFRPPEKGLIILIADWMQLKPLIRDIPENLLEKVKKTWPGPVTWIFPKSDTVPDWLTGNQDSIAIRMSAHPIAHDLCLSGPIVSTSANISTYSPAKTRAEIEIQFPSGIDAIVEGELGESEKPSVIFDVITGKQLR